jgi:hypothetical protein
MYARSSCGCLAKHRGDTADISLWLLLLLRVSSPLFAPRFQTCCDQNIMSLQPKRHPSCIDAIHGHPQHAGPAAMHRQAHGFSMLYMHKELNPSLNIVAPGCLSLHMVCLEGRRCVLMYGAWKEKIQTVGAACQVFSTQPTFCQCAFHRSSCSHQQPSSPP